MMFITIKAILGLLFVIGLLYCSLKSIQKYTKIGQATGASGGIKLDAMIYIDDATKVVNLIHGSVGYLVLIGRNGSLLLDKYEKQ